MIIVIIESNCYEINHNFINEICLVSSFVSYAYCK